MIQGRQVGKQADKEVEKLYREKKEKASRKLILQVAGCGLTRREDSCVIFLRGGGAYLAFSGWF